MRNIYVQNKFLFKAFPTFCESFYDLPDILTTR